MKKYIILFLIISAAVSCYGRRTFLFEQDDEICKKQISKALENVNKFHFTKQTCYLDSALQILKDTKSYSQKYTIIILMNEVQIYFFKNDFALALDSLNKVPSSVFPFSAFKEIVENKIKAKEAGIKGDTTNQRKYYQVIISIYQKYIEENYRIFTNKISQSDIEKIDCTQEDIFLTELYYYISQIDGVEKAIKRIKSFKIKAKGNLLYFRKLEKKIRSNDAKTMGIFFY